MRPSDASNKLLHTMIAGCCRWIYVGDYKTTIRPRHYFPHAACPLFLRVRAGRDFGVFNSSGYHRSFPDTLNFSKFQIIIHRSYQIDLDTSCVGCGNNLLSERNSKAYRHDTVRTERVRTSEEESVQWCRLALHASISLCNRLLDGWSIIKIRTRFCDQRAGCRARSCTAEPL